MSIFPGTLTSRLSRCTLRRCPIPFVIIHDNNLATEGALSGNIGLNATANQGFHNQLAANADYRAQNAQDFQQQQAQDSGDESAYRTLISDITRRQIADQQIQGRTGLAGLNNDARTQIAGLNNNTRTAIAGMNSDARVTVGAGHDTTSAANTQAKINSTEDMYWNGTLPEKYYNIDEQGRRVGVKADALAAHQDAVAHAKQAKDQADLVQRQLEVQARSEAAAGRNVNAQRIAAAHMQLESLKAELSAQARTFNDAGVADATRRIREFVANPLQSINNGPTTMQAEENRFPPGSMTQSAQPSQVAPPAQSNNPVMIGFQIAQQVNQAMPTASIEAKRIEVKQRLLRAGIDPVSLGIN